MRKDIAIYGAGGLGRETAVLIRDIGGWTITGFFDDGKKKGDSIDGLPVLGGLSEINSLTTPLSLVLAISDPITKEKLASQIGNKKIEFPVLIHPTCVVSDNANNSIGQGTILTAGVLLTTHITIGEFVLVNLATTVGHDVTIGAFSSIMPGVNISGAVMIGKRSTIGTGACILQNIGLGAETIVGAGAVVTKSFEGGFTLVGVPAVKLL